MISFIEKVKDKERHSTKVEYKWSSTQQMEEGLLEIERDLRGITIKYHVWTFLDGKLNKPAVRSHL